uniref:Uncharacterized protein n=1 Tax=Timema shepardi TaxID=629360 RepID=A0A7R9B8M4_TIMSH|nr:unnamed protein product [Timema shepardi]
MTGNEPRASNQSNIRQFHECCIVVVSTGARMLLRPGALFVAGSVVSVAGSTGVDIRETVRCQNISCKILYLVACIGAYILLTAYSGILVSFLAVSDYSLSSTSVDKMFEENRSQAIGVVKQSAEHMILKASTLDVIVKLRKGAIVDRTNFAPPGWHTRFLAIPNLVMYDSVNEAIYALWAKKEAVVLTDNHLTYDPDPWYTVVHGYSYRVHFSVGFRDGLHHTVNYK